jgi:hypothetical protein
MIELKREELERVGQTRIEGKENCGQRAEHVL